LSFFHLLPQETSEGMGTLDEILEEAGCQHESNNWTPPEFVSLDRLSLSLLKDHEILSGNRMDPV
jgi:hypothetical protein